MEFIYGAGSRYVAADEIQEHLWDSTICPTDVFYDIRKISGILR